MRMILHAVSDDVRHFIIATIFHIPHRMQDTALDRLQTVIDMWYCTFQDYIRCVVQKPTLIHPVQMHDVNFLFMLLHAVGFGCRLIIFVLLLFSHYAIDSSITFFSTLNLPMMNFC